MTGRTVLLYLLSLTGFHLSSLWIHHHDALDERMGGTDTVASTTVMAVGIVIVSVLLVRWLTGPLRRLAQTADGIGRGHIVPVPHNGPEEVQRLAQALDAMQTRITRLVDDRTQALAAVSHDLRTPITRMRLRAGFLDDADTQTRMEADLDEMEGMIAATLAYLQGEAESEIRQLTDVGVLSSTLCDAAADAGGSVSFDGPVHLDFLCRPVALRRAISNLIVNAVSYGETARVTLTTGREGLRITVDDDGPGIAPDELERVFQPFYRLEASRNRGTGGVGLGLTISRQAILEQQGTLTIENRPEGGLRAIILLPFPRGTVPQRGGAIRSKDISTSGEACSAMRSTSASVARPRQLGDRERAPEAPFPRTPGNPGGDGGSS